LFSQTNTTGSFQIAEGADVGRAVAEETHRYVLVAPVLRAPRRATGDRQMRTDDRVGTHDAVLHGGQVHRTALAAHQPVIARHQLPEHLLKGDAARERMGMAAVGAEAQVAGLHRHRATRRDRLLPEGQVARTLDQILQKQVVRPLFGLADQNLRAVEPQPLRLADVVRPRTVRVHLGSR
jgi:hypothetical protein